MPRTYGIILLGVWLVVYGILACTNVEIMWPKYVLGVLAFVTAGLLWGGK